MWAALTTSTLFLLASTAVAVEPARPTLEEQGISDDHFNVSFVPGDFNPDEQRPVGNAYFVKYREEGDSEWQVRLHFDSPVKTLCLEETCYWGQSRSSSGWTHSWHKVRSCRGLRADGRGRHFKGNRVSNAPHYDHRRL